MPVNSPVPWRQRPWNPGSVAGVVLTVGLLITLGLPPAGLAFTDAELAFITPGKTTAEEIRTRLGQPLMKVRDHTLAYLWNQAQPSSAASEPGKATTLPRGSLLVELGQGGIVQRVERLTAPPADRLAEPLQSVGLSATGMPTALRYDSDGTMLVAVQRDGRLMLRHPGDAAAQESYTSDDGQPLMAFSRDGEAVAITPLGGADAIEIWRRGTSQKMRTLTGTRAGFTSLAYSPDGERLAANSIDGTTRVWFLGTGRLALTLRGHRAHSMFFRGALVDAVFPAGRRMLATAELSPDPSKPGRVKLWSLANGVELATIPHHGLSDALGYRARNPSDHLLAFSPGGDLLAVHCGTHVDLWALASETGKRRTGDAVRTLLALLPLAGDDTGTVAFSPDGEAIAVAGIEYALLWYWREAKTVLVETGDMQRSTDPPIALAFGPDGSRLATAVWPAARLRVWALPENNAARVGDSH